MILQSRRQTSLHIGYSCCVDRTTMIIHSSRAGPLLFQMLDVIRGVTTMVQNLSPNKHCFWEKFSFTFVTSFSSLSHQRLHHPFFLTQCHFPDRSTSFRKLPIICQELAERPWCLPHYWYPCGCTYWMHDIYGLQVH